VLLVDHLLTNDNRSNARSKNQDLLLSLLT
jgi:hypothetical protein